MLFPPQWRVTNTRKAIIGQAEDNTAQLKIMIARNTNRLSPANYLRDITHNPMLQRSEDFTQYGLMGHTGVIQGKQGASSQRVAVLFQGSKAYYLEGTILNEENIINVENTVDSAVHHDGAAEKEINYDELFLKSIQSFRPEKQLRNAKKSKKIHYVKANNQTNIEQLAKQINLGAYSAQQLRLINGLYPRGEPKAGDWIKIIQ
jgi:predicted Zn-dependent protease